MIDVYTNANTKIRIRNDMSYSVEVFSSKIY